MAKVVYHTDTKGNVDEHALVWYNWAMGHMVCLPVNTNVGTFWEFDGDRENPTLSPSILHHHPRPDGTEYRDHYFIRKGVIEYQSDSTHSLAGKNVRMVDITDDVRPDPMPDIKDYIIN